MRRKIEGIALWTAFSTRTLKEISTPSNFKEDAESLGEI